MKKILVLLGLFLFIQNCCLSTETLQGAVDSSITMSDLSVFNEKNLFGLKDKNGR